jgi:hypothetical protein
MLAKKRRSAQLRGQKGLNIHQVLPMADTPSSEARRKPHCGYFCRNKLKKKNKLQGSQIFQKQLSKSG